MKKQMITVVVIIVLAAVGMFLYSYFRVLSPPATATLTTGDLTLTVTYSRPSVRDRVIFGTRGEEALQPYGEYWRLGANAATEMTITRDVLFNGEAVRAGTYRMYAVPGRESFEFVLNSELGVSGSQEPDPALDVLRTTVPVETLRSPVEQFTISMEESAEGMRIIFEWAEVRLVVPVSVTLPSQPSASARHTTTPG